jgi:hypothetical protein
MSIEIEWEIIGKFSKLIIEQKDRSLSADIRNGIPKLKNNIRVWCLLSRLF